MRPVLQATTDKWRPRAVWIVQRNQVPEAHQPVRDDAVLDAETVRISSGRRGWDRSRVFAHARHAQTDPCLAASTHISLRQIKESDAHRFSMRRRWSLAVAPASGLESI